MLLNECTNYPDGKIRCTNAAVGWMTDLGGNRIPGAAWCQACADRVIAEYSDKLNETWTLEPEGE